MSTSRQPKTHTLDPAEMPTVYRAAFKMLGDFWTLTIIYVLHCSPTSLRFNELQRQITDISPSVLTQRLKKLEQLSLVERLSDTTGQPAISYQLTPRGEALMPILREMLAFARTYID